jgi:hypothetical protein
MSSFGWREARIEGFVVGCCPVRRRRYEDEDEDESLDELSAAKLVSVELWLLSSDSVPST